jgi:uncharacterized protein (TIGR02265 family)
VSTMDGSVFEGLFVRQLKPDATLSAELAKVGFNPSRLEAKYPEEVFARAVEVAAKHSFADVPHELAHRAMGTALIDGYFETILGRITGSMMPILGVGGALKRVQQLWRVAQPSMTVAAQLNADGSWTIDFQNKVMGPDMVAGILEAALKHSDKRARLHVEERLAGGGKLRCTLVA